MTADDSPNTSSLRSRLRELVRLTAGYSIASFIGPIFTIFLTPLYMKVLQPDDYGILELAITFGTLMMMLGILGLNHAVAAFFYDGDAMHGRRVLSTAALVSVGCSVVISLVITLVAQPLATISFGSPQWAILLYLSAFNLPFAVFYGMCQSALRLRMEVTKANILAILYLVLTFTCIAFFVLGLNAGVLGIQMATVIVTVIVTCVGFFLTRDEWVWPARTLAQPLVLAGLPLIPGSLAFWAMAYIDRLILPLYNTSMTDLGLYAIAYRLASMLAIAIVPFQNAWLPLALSMQNDSSARHTYSKVLTYFVAGGLGMALVLGLFAHEIFLLLAILIDKNDYIPASPYVSLLTYVAVANGAGVAVSVGAYVTKQTAALGWTTLIGAAINLLLNIILIPPFGVWGAVWATAIGYTTVPVMLYLASQRLYAIPFEIPKVVLALGAQAAFMAIGIFYQTGDLFFDIPFKLFLLMLYGIALIILRVLEPHEIRMMLQMARQPRAALAAVMRK
ncbi:MAG: oligosaccharide flippase family protein [Chloroflexota bacterium]